jgi:hypothetical protein
MVTEMDFRFRLLETLRAIRPVLEEPGVLIAGSEVPNLLEAGARARATLVAKLLQRLEQAKPES